MSVIPDGFWIERSEGEYVTDWYIFIEGEPLDRNDQPIPVATVYHVQPLGILNDGYHQKRRIRWSLSLPHGHDEVAFARTFAAALTLAADEAEGKLSDD